MTTRRSKTTSSHATASRVEVTGRLGAHVRSRELPSGDVVTTFTVIVDRPTREQRGSTTVDAIACTTTSRRLATRIESWEAGTLITAIGVLRRRFWRASGAGQVGSSTEVLVRNLCRAESS